jgi:hypothetical protein
VDKSIRFSSTTIGPNDPQGTGFRQIGDLLITIISYTSRRSAAPAPLVVTSPPTRRSVIERRLGGETPRRHPQMPLRIASAVIALGCRRSSSKSSISRWLTEAALDSLLTDQRSRVRAQRHCVAVIIALAASGIVA